MMGWYHHPAKIINKRKWSHLNKLNHDCKKENKYNIAPDFVTHIYLCLQ